MIFVIKKNDEKLISFSFFESNDYMKLLILYVKSYFVTIGRLILRLAFRIIILCLHLYGKVNR